jgi:hypothetical protein
MNSYMFWHWGPILRESYEPTCHLYVFIVVVNIIKMLRLLKYMNLIVMIFYSIDVCYINHKPPQLSFFSCVCDRAVYVQSTAT